MKNVGFIIFTLLAGGGLALQAALNAKLGKGIQQPIVAGIISFLVGLGILFILSATGAMGRIKVAGIGEVPWWAWFGGVFGAVFVVVALVGVSKIGTAVLLACAVSGQIVVGLLLDTMGWLGVEKVPLSGWRIGGALLLITGVIIMGKK